MYNISRSLISSLEDLMIVDKFPGPVATRRGEHAETFRAHVARDARKKRYGRRAFAGGMLAAVFFITLLAFDTTGAMMYPLMRYIFGGVFLGMCTSGAAAICYLVSYVRLLG